MIKPTTVQDVMALPEIAEYEHIDCPNCHHTISMRVPHGVLLNTSEVLFVRVNGETWEPVCNASGLWLRRRVNYL